MDVDHSGVITASGLERALHSHGLHVAEEELKRTRHSGLRDTFDYLDEGHLNYTNFLLATLDKREMLYEERLFATFQHFDVDRQGFITVEKLAQALIHAGLEVQETEVEQMIHDFKLNSDRKIDYEEFRTMLTSAVESASPVKQMRSRVA